MCFSTSVISIPQFALKQWPNDFTRFRRWNQSQPNRCQWWALLQWCRRTWHPRLQWAREREVIEIPGVQLLRKTKDCGDPMSTATERPHLTTFILNNSWNAFPQQATHSGMITMLSLFNQLLAWWVWVEIRIWFLKKQHSLLGQHFSWIKQFEMNLNNNEQEIAEVQLEEYA